MKNQPRTFNARALPRFLRAIYIAGLLPALLFLLNVQSIQAGSAMWEANPTSGDWNTPVNWTPDTVPSGPGDSAMFQSSTQTNVSLSANTEVNGIVFGAGASPFTIVASSAITLTISGAGITNNSVAPENIVAAGTSNFGVPAGAIHFINNATAGDATFTMQGGADTTGNGAQGGIIRFINASKGGSATFILEGGTGKFGDGGVLAFLGRSTAGDATLIAYGGESPSGNGAASIAFQQRSSGGNARVMLLGNGQIGGDYDGASTLDISGNTAPRMTIGSIEGDGNVTLGDRTLTVGSNNLSTVFSGLISDHGSSAGGDNGSLIKIGRGKLTLTESNSYSGGTTIEQGKLLINNSANSGTGKGQVQVNGGKLGGKGTIAGAVTIGTGDGSGAVLAPGYLHGAGRPGALTIQSPLTFNSDGIYQMEVDSSNVAADEVVANGVTINAGAQFSFLDFGSASLPPGTLFTAINNTAANPIAGAFGNLPDGSTFTNNGNTFKVNYKGGDGNDLTLTVR